MAVVRALRADGHTVRSVAEEQSGISDERVADWAIADDLVLLTEDRDFGRLFFAGRQGPRGVIYMRYPAGARQAFPAEVVGLVQSLGERIRESFVVAQPGRTRISPRE